ncbi:hypothetical protein JW979_06415 [bacterium]|nr:hypothetical protein [candidate division CSSED10-310 bacterium]
MSNSMSKDSRWRREMATQLSSVYSAHDNVRTILLGGSPSKGLSDAYSDIDMVVYWEELDTDFIDNAPLTEWGGNRGLHLKMSPAGSQMELYYFDTLIFEVGHMTLKEWDSYIDEVLNKHSLNPMLLKTMGGFLSALPLYGEKLADNMKSKIREMPRALAVKIVQQNLGFFWKGCIVNQGINRGEILFVYDAFCATLKRLLFILAGLNGRYFAPVEPRWIEHELEHMDLKPADMWQRIKSIFKMDYVEANKMIEELIVETVALVERHMPEVDMSRYRETSEIEINPTYKMPKIKKLT